MKFPKRNKIDKNKKIIFNFEYKYKQPYQGLKPNGFWYSCYDSWYEWCLQNMPSGLHKYIPIEVKYLYNPNESIV